MQKHTAGPWSMVDRSNWNGGYHVRGGTGRYVASTVENLPRQVGEQEANAARIVACVNALDGIEDPEAFVKAAAAMAAALRPGHGVTVEHFGGDVDAYNTWVARHSGG